MSEVAGETFGAGATFGDEGSRHSKNELAGVDGYEDSDPLGISSIRAIGGTDREDFAVEVHSVSDRSKD